MLDSISRAHRTDVSTAVRAAILAKSELALYQMLDDSVHLSTAFTSPSDNCARVESLPLSGGYTPVKASQLSEAWHRVGEARASEVKDLTTEAVQGALTKFWNDLGQEVLSRTVYKVHEFRHALRQRLDELVGLPPDWDSYGAPPPSRAVVTEASRLLDSLFDSALDPDRVVASPQGGVAFLYLDGTRTADIEIFNEGSILVGLYDDRDVKVVDMTNESEESITKVIRDWVRRAATGTPASER